ncbi:MAG: hypothetical protein ACRENH_11845, partial [Gemmatimonadaceae bacterium]
MISGSPNERSTQRLLAWFALLIAGQAASLLLIRAGRIVSYQHYDVAALWATGTRQIAIAILVLQGIAVLYGLRHAWRDLAAWVRRHMSLPMIVVILGVLGIAGAAPSLSPRTYAEELVLAFGIQLIAFGNVVCFARSAPDALLARWQSFCDRWLGSDTGNEPLPGRFFDRTALMAALWTLAVTLVLVVVVYQRIPHVPDEIVYMLQARYFAAGQIALPPPPVPQAFDVDLMYLDDARWFSPVPPGWPALLAIGVAARIPWIVDP